MGNFKVDPDVLRDSARHLTRQVAPAYAESAATLRSRGVVDSPGFGIALFPVAAAYASRLDFMALDLQGAHDVVSEIATRLEQTAAEYERAENLNITGFDGSGHTPQGFGSALPGAIVDAVTPALAAGGLELGVILLCAGSLETCAGLCPTFIPAALAVPFFIANMPSIFGAASALINEAAHVKDVLNSVFAQVCEAAKSDWSGEGATDYGTLITKIKGHLDQLADYIDTIGSTVKDVAALLTGLWLGLIALAGPFLVWLIAMRLAEASPPWLQDAVLEPIIETAGVAMSSAVLTTLAGIESVAAALATVMGGLGSAFLDTLSPPDRGKVGVPDMQEFHVDQNYQTPL